MGLRRVVIISAVLLSLLTNAPAAQQSAKGGINSIQQEPLKEWLTYIASDELQGRATYSEGLGLAAGYISSHLAQWGVKPAGDNGTYLQVVRVLGVRTTSRATVTVEVNGQTRTFNDGDGITFPKSMGGKQTVVADQVQFAGYGLTLPAGTHDDYASVDAKGKLVVWLGPSGPKTSESGLFRLLNSAARNRAAIEKGAIAAIGPAGGGGFGGRGRGGAAPAAAPAATPPAGAAPPAPAAPDAGVARAVDDGDFTTVSGTTTRSRRRSPARTRSSSSSSAGRNVKYADLKEQRREAGAAAAVRAQGRQGHLQRRCRLHHRPHAPHPQRRRHRRRQRPEAEGHLRGLRRALRPRRIPRGPRRRARRPGAGQPGRSHQQRRRR